MGIIGSALGAVSAIAGGISARRAAKKAKRYIEQQRQKNQDWYDRRYNEDATQRADAQRLLTMTEESIRNRNRQAAGAQAVMGGTDESVAAAKAANNNALADVTSAIAANAAERKDNIEQQYMETDRSLAEQLSNLELGRAQSITQATQSAVGAFNKLGY